MHFGIYMWNSIYIPFFLKYKPYLLRTYPLPYIFTRNGCRPCQDGTAVSSYMFIICKNYV
ncbi:hypothetical protein SAMN04487895_109145 [Paenibacillus sophorae]|uniref:Uncharacterized protein n=1 Tax=Paenibacillus sophorae TaxID=1333845 RepID=A0A1H8R4X1_9BACL|nr:hypothetical protein SAMN04487895_109145 [Paenibacillus sophorae]